MINKFYKRINNKYSTVFKFIFFLRYLIGIFFLFFVLFLVIPNFFDYKKKDEIIKNFLLESYNLKLNNYENINFNSLPTPNLEIRNASVNLNSTSIILDIENLNIYPGLINIYNYKNFHVKKISLNKIKTTLQVDELKILSKKIYQLKKKLILNDLDLKIFKKNEFLINLENINFSNYGYNKNIINGEIFDRKFKLITDNNLKKINFNLMDTGLDIEIDYNEVKKDFPVSGILKAKLFNSKIKFNFKYNNEKFQIYNSYFRNKDLSFNNESVITYNPFFYINSNFVVEDISIKLLKNLNLNKILEFKNIIKKINSKNKLNYKSKKFSKSFIDDLKLDIILEYGRLSYIKNFYISKSFFNCKGDIDLLNEFPILYFDCSVISKDKKNLLKKFSIKNKTKNEPLNLYLKGNINILNNKINFKRVQINKNYDASKDDLEFLKDRFEVLLFNENFMNIFRLDKIKNFILEVS